MDKLTLSDAVKLESKLKACLFGLYEPNQTIDILEECIKILQPYAEKEREKTHA